MSNNRCKATTKSGKRCQLQADSSNYCHIHKPSNGTTKYKNSTEPIGNAQSFPLRKFSERRGLKPVSLIIQVSEMSNELKNSLWNVLSSHHFRHYKELATKLSFSRGNPDKFSLDLWADFFIEPIDSIPSSPESTLQTIKKHFMSFDWNEVYDFVEYVLNYFNDKNAIKSCNQILERELSGYRFIDGVITEITDKQEIQLLETTFTDQKFLAVTSHLKSALSLLSDRKKPDYRNSIKESISAVESLAKTMTNNPKATLGDALAILERSGTIHPSLKKAFSSLYGYTSDEGGIRHAMLDEPNLTVADAKFFLLSCTSFINYLKSKI